MVYKNLYAIKKGEKFYLFAPTTTMKQLTTYFFFSGASN